LAQEVLREVQAAVAEEVSGLLMQYVYVPCHSRVLPLVEVRVSVAELQQMLQQALVAIARQQVWVQVSVGQDDSRASMVHRLDHRAAGAYPW
jgi:hypothetical protein